MPIQPISFPTISFEQANPGMVKMKYLQESMRNRLANQAAQTQNQYLGPMLQQQLTQAQLNNQILQPKAELAPQMARGDLDKLLAEIGLTKAQTGEVGAQTGLIGAQTNKLNQLLPYEIQAQQQALNYLPLEEKIKLMNAVSKSQVSGAVGSPLNQISRALRSPEMLSLGGSNPQVAQALSTAIANSLQNIGQPQQAIDEQGTMQQKAQQQPINITPQDVTALQRALRDQLVKNTTTAQIQNQRYFGDILENQFSVGDQYMPSVTKYVGLSNKLGKSVDQLKSAMGSTPEDYSNYLTFTRTAMPLMVGEMKRTLGVQATDTMTKYMENVANPDYWDSNPAQAMKQWNTLKQIYKNSVRSSLAKTASEVAGPQYGGQQAAAPASNDFSNMSDEQLMAIAGGE